MRGLPVVVTFLALLAPARTGPISSAWDNSNSQCSTKCIASQKFQYARQTTYEFEYQAETATSMEDASEDTARLAVTATALIHVLNDCDMVLQLRDVSVKESDPNSPSMRTAPESARAAALLERQPLRFSFQDGVVEELCPSQGEELWSLNVKRGVLSAFQNSMSRLDNDQTVTEVDVTGTCPAQYQVENKGWYSTTVKRTKDLLACTDRHGYQTALQASPYHVPSSVQSLPLLKSSHHCQQTVGPYGILSSATCTETHQFRPFSRENSGAVTKVTQSLQYKTQSSLPVPVQPVSNRVSLMYDHGNQEQITQQAQQRAEEVLRQLCRDTLKDIRPDTPSLFSSLVSTLRRVDSASLQSLYSRVQQSALCANNVRVEKFFVDALPMAGTEATVGMMTQMLTNNDVTGIEADMWLTSLALIQEPSSAMLDQVKPLLTSQSLQEKALLPVTTMVNKFCQHHPQCASQPSVTAIMTSLEDLIGSACYVNKKNMDQVLMALRAIGNAGHVISVATVVNQCVRRSRNPMEVRVSAAQAFRRLPCDADRSAVTTIMEDTQEDSELRIAAYLAVMTCPDDVILQKIQRLLESETDEQVGSFIWSHLTNLQETSSPHKQAVRELLKNVQLSNNYDLGRLQFSRNYEGSAFLKRLNSGAAAEGNLVWSSSSSLPRSLSANLTVDLFGRSLNLMDFGLRLEGLEYLLETMLGPYGYFGQSDKSRKSDSQLDELKGSLYLRMMGNEMSYQRFQGLESFTSASSFNMLDFLLKLSKKHDVSMTHSTEFLDTEMTVPTSCGLPLSLAVKGSATVDLRASGSMDLRKVSATPRSLQIDGEFRPSGAIRVSGHMTVDAQVSRAALHVTGTLHSSSALKARVDLDRGRVLSVELGVPEEKMELFDISSEFSIVHNTVEKKQKMITENRRSVKMCTGDLAARVTGLELCGELQYPNASTSDLGPYFPFTGPTSLTVALLKRDTHSSYKLLFKRVENKKKTMAQLSFNTPGSKVDRALAFDLVINHADKQLEISAASPWKTAEFKGAITSTKKLMGVSGSFVTDDVNTYALTTEVEMAESKGGMRYSPRVEIRHPGSEDMALTGMVSLEPKAVTVDLSLSGVIERPWNFKSALTNTGKEKSLVSSVNNGGKLEYSLSVGTKMSMASSKITKIQVNPFLSVKTPRRELVSLEGSTMYTQGKILQSELTFSLLKYKPLNAQFTATKSERKSSVRYLSKASVKSSVVSGSMSTMASVRKGRLLSGRSTVSYSVPRVVKDKLELVAKLSDRSTKAYNKYSMRSSLESRSFPDYNTDVKVNVDHKKKLSSGELELRYGGDRKDKSKRVLLSSTVTRKIKNPQNVDLSYKMAAEAPQHDINYRIKGSHNHSPRSLDSSVTMTLGKGKDVSAALTLNDASSKLKRLNGELSLSAPSTDLTLKSALNQVSKKQWEHSIDLKSGENRHSLNTVYQNKGGNSHQLNTTLGVAGMTPVTLTGGVNMDWRDLQLAAALHRDKNMYGISGSQKLAKSANGKWGVEVTMPSRRMTLTADAGKGKGNYEGSLEAAWDADNDKDAKVLIKGLAGSKSTGDYSSHKARVSLTSPLEGYRQLEAGAEVDSSQSQHQVSTRLVMGDKKRQITTSLAVAAPLTLRDLDLTFKAKTPFRGYGSMGLAVLHKMDTGLNSKVTLTLQKDQVEVTLKAMNRGTDESRDVEAQLEVQSSLRQSKMTSLIISAAHQDDGRHFRNKVGVKVNDESYSGALNMEVDTGSNSGDLTITWPQDEMKNSWTHRQSSTGLTSTLSSTWASNKRVQIDVTAQHVPGSLSGSLALQSPWKQARDWRADMKTQYGSGKIESSSSVQKENVEIFTHRLTMTADVSKTDMDFMMTSPWTEPISSKVNAKYASFPMSGSAEFSWEPRKKVTAEGSIIINSWDDLDISTRVTTPARDLRTLAAEVSSKAEGSTVVSQVTVDLGMRKNVILTSRVERDLSAVRVKLTTPFDQLRVVDTGMDISLQQAVGKVKADFKATPLIGQYQVSASLDAEDDFSASLRVDTPRPEFPYLQILATSKEKRRVRQSRVEVELSPRQTYSVDATYSFDVPLVLDVSMATPLSGYESLSASFRHNMRDTAMDVSAQVMYTNDQAVKMTAMMDWSRGLDGSLTVSTPFIGWEQNSATIRHEGEWDDFSSLADVSVGGQGLTASAKFLHKMKTEAQMTVSTPWAGWEKIEAALSRKGDLSNLRGTASVAYGGQKMEGGLMTKWNSRKARLAASLTTPYTEDLKLSLEQGEDWQSEASLSYGRQYSLDTTTSSAVYNSRELSASADIKYRLGGPRHVLTASFSKLGSLQDLTLSTTASLDKQEVSMTGELNTLRDIKAAVALRTPFSRFESMGASFHKNGDLSSMTIESNVEYMTDRNINGKVELSLQDLSQISFRGSLTSPISGLERSSVSLSHSTSSRMCRGSFNVDTTISNYGSLEGSYQKTGQLDDMKAESRLTYNGQSLLEADLAHKVTYRRLTSSLHVLTPVMPELNMNINHQGDMSRFTTKASASFGADKVSSNTQFTLSGDNVDLSQSVTSYVMYESHQAAITLSKAGPLNDVTLQLSGSVDRKQAKVTGKFSNVRDLSTSLELESPFNGFSQMGASVSKIGDSSDLTVTAAANLEHQKVEVISKFTQDSEVRGSVDVTTPFTGYTQMGAMFSYDDQSAMLSGNMQNDRIEATGKLVTDNIVEGNVDIKTPFNGYRQMGAAFNYGGEKAMISGNLENDKIEATGRYISDNIVEGNVDIKTPFNGYEQMGAAFNYGGGKAMISGNLQNDKIEATGRMVNGDDFEAIVDIMTPFNGYKQMGASVSYGGEKAKISGNLQNDRIEATGRFVSDNTVEGNVDITTPFKGFKQMGASFSYGGEKAMVSGHLQNKKIEATGRMVNGDAFEVSVDTTTPFNGYKQMGASFNLGGNSMTAAATLQNKKVEAIANYDNSDDITGSVEISTPFRGYTQLGGKFRYSGDLSDVLVTSSGNVESSKMEVTAKFANGQDVSGSLTLLTPFPGYSSLGSSFALTGDWSDLSFTSDAFLQNQRLEAKAGFQNDQEMSGTVTVNTPFPGYRHMGASFQQKGDLDDFSLLMATNLMDDKLQARASFANQQDVSGSVSLDTPFQGFTQLGAGFKHAGSANNFNTEGQFTYMDGQTVSGKVTFYKYRLRRIDASAQLNTPFLNWEMTKLSYKHAGNANKLQCTAMLESSEGQTHSADLKVDLRKDQDVQLTVKTPYDGLRLTELTHSLSQSDSSAQWTGSLTYGQGQRTFSQLTVSYPDDRFSSQFDLQTPFTSDLKATFDFQGVMTAHTRKMTLQYGDKLQMADEIEFQINQTPLFLLNEMHSYTYNDVTTTRSLHVRHEGPLNDVTLVVKGQLNGEEMAMDAAFKNEYDRVEANVKINTPFEGYSDLGASFQHVGEVSSAFSTQARVDYADGQEVAGKLDFMRSTWRRLELTAELTTPFEDWTMTQAQYRHQADNDGFTCYTSAEYLNDQRVTGDLRVTSSPHPEVTLAVTSPWTNWEQLSASGSFQNDGWGNKELSSKVDLDQGFVYTINTALSHADSTSFTARVTTPHADWTTLEARASLDGGLQNFKTSAYLSAPLLDSVSASASARYGSLFDLTAGASLDTPFDSVKEWKIEVVNGERSDQKTSHVTVGWSGDQEIVLDGTWSHSNGWNERHLLTDVSLVTPFEAVRSTSWLLEHHSSQGKYEQKMTGSLNGDTLVDLDLATLTDLPQVTLILTEPRAMQYSAALTSEGAELSLDWNRNDPDSNLRLLSHLTASSDSDSLLYNLELKAIQPSGTVGAKYSLTSTQGNTASQGELYWGRGSNRRMFYSLDLTDISRRSSTSYEGKVKVGVMSRAVQLSGAVSHTPLSRQMDATLQWDADRDQKKQVALKTRWTSGDKNKADVTLSLPAINQEVRVQSEVAVNQGRTLLDTSTALSYSPDSSKVLTFTSKIQDTTGAWDSSSNYTLEMTLTHPHTDLDVAVTSHLGASQDRYSAAIDTWYLTSRRQRKNMALRGEIDQLRQQLTMEMVSPVKKVEVKGQVKSVEPYSLSLTNRFDDDQTIQADVTLDTNKRSLSFRTNYDLEHPERNLIVKAFYVNDSAINAEVYRDHVTEVISDALLAIRLNSSTLLHSRLHWRPSALSDLQEFSLLKLGGYAVRSKDSLVSLSDAVREELAARYSRSAASLAQDLRPLVELVDSEMGQVASQLQVLRKQLNRFYRRSPLLQNAGSAVTERFLALQQYVGEVSDIYQQRAEMVSQQMRDTLQAMTQYRADIFYQQAADSLLNSMEELIDHGLEQLTETVMSLDNYLLAVRDRSVRLSNTVSEAAHNISNHPHLLYLKHSLNPTPYLHSLTNKLAAVRMPEEYSAAIYRASSHVNDVMADVLNQEKVKQIRAAYNEVYQQGVWAYHYWQVEENLKKHLISVTTLLKEIVQEELEVYTRHFRFLQESHVTVWQPEQGEVQTELRLPVAMETLDSMPDMTPLVTQYNDVIDSVPDMDTVQYFYDHYVPEAKWWYSNNSDHNNTTPSNEAPPVMRRRFYNPRKAVVAMQ